MAVRIRKRTICNKNRDQCCQEQKTAAGIVTRQEALEISKPTAKDLKRIGVIDQILPAPEEVTDLEGFAASIGKYLQKSIQELSRIKINKLLEQREKRALSFGLPKHQGKVHELKKILERPFKKFFYKLPPDIQVVNFDGLTQV